MSSRSEPDDAVVDVDQVDIAEAGLAEAARRPRATRVTRPGAARCIETRPPWPELSYERRNEQ